MPFNDYHETLDFLYNRLPYFSKQGAKALDFKLEKTIKLCEELGNPQNKLKHIHIAGTNGKGSTSSMLSAVFQLHGYKVGLYTSPHLKDFSERIRICGQPIEKELVVNFVNENFDLIKGLQPTFFELTVAMAFWYFHQKNTEINIIEVGMGGRLDSTNIIQPLVSVITNISLDHQLYLGDTLQKIAFEKGGIIKENIPAVIGEIQSETIEVFRKICKERNSLAKEKLNSEYLLNHLKTNTYQDKNIETVLKTLEVLSDLGYEFEDEKIIEAISNFKQISGLKGRWQTLAENPKIICDTGHNVAGIAEIVSLLEKEKYEKLHFVLGMVAEKEVSKVLELLPKDAEYYFCKADNERSMEAETLRSLAKSFDLMGGNYASVSDAIASAQKKAQKEDLIFVGGSTFVVAEIPFL
jgi:dihydrofolate synthase/folylpolyglutamate synthase